MKLKVYLPSALIIFAYLTFSLSFSNTVLAQDEILTVSAESMASLAFYPSRSAPANVISLNNSLIPAEISAIVRSIPVRVGDAVESGDLLAQLDCRQTQLNFEIESAREQQLRSSLNFDRRELERREMLIAGGNIGESDLDRSQNAVITKEGQLSVQQALLGIAKLNTERCSIRAPYGGIITARLASEGENLNLGQALLKLVQIDELEVVANIALDDITSFSDADNYFFEQNDIRYGVDLRSILPLVELNSRIRITHFLFNNEPAVTGSSGRLVWQSPESHVPARFLQLRDEVLGIFVFNNNVARFIELTNAEEGRPVAFNMSPETMIITDGRFGLVDGQAIQLR